MAQRRVLITGAGSGLGQALAHRYARAGDKVACVDLDAARANLTRAALPGEGHLALSANVGSDDAMEQVHERIAGEWGGVDVLVNNAGIAESAALDRTTDDQWDRTLAVNVSSAFWLCRAVVPGMVARGYGRVVNVASNAGLRGYAYTSAYCASKHAVVGLTRALAVELARTGVTVNAVCPGFVDTEMSARAVDRIARSTKRSAEDARRALEALSPQRRLMTVDEVAHLVWALVPDAARGVNGQAIALDGGQTA